MSALFIRATNDHVVSTTKRYLDMKMTDDRRHDFDTRRVIDEVLLSSAEPVDKIAAIMMILEDLPAARRIVAEHIANENEEF